MKIDLHEIKIRDLCAGYEDLSVNEEGITGYGGRLNIRPKYQREFVYDVPKRNAVMDTVWNGFPLNVMYWVKVGDCRSASGSLASGEGFLSFTQVEAQECLTTNNHKNSKQNTTKMPSKIPQKCQVDLHNQNKDNIFAPNFKI